MSTITQQRKMETGYGNLFVFMFSFLGGLTHYLRIGGFWSDWGEAAFTTGTLAVVSWGVKECLVLFKSWYLKKKDENAEERD